MKLVFMITCFIVLCCSLVASAQDCSTWYETTEHSSVFRNVKTFGARGDGVTDDTAAIVRALTQGRTTQLSTKQPAVVYFPPGTYKVSDNLPMYPYTHMIGNFKCRPKLLLADNTKFGHYGPYLVTASLTWDTQNTDNFYHQFHHIDIDLGLNNPGATAMHWAVAQGTSIRNVTIYINGGKSALFIENGGGGFIGDLEVIGGNPAIMIGGQQYTLRGVTVRNAVLGIQVLWNWAFTFFDVAVYNTPTAISFQGSAVTSLVVMDSYFENVGIAVLADSRTAVVLDRVTGNNVKAFAPSLVGGSGIVRIPSWRQGTTYSGGRPLGSGSGPLPVVRPDVDLPRRARPTFGPTVFNVRAAGARGDGVTDDTAAIQRALSEHDQVFFPFGTYMISGTITLRSGNALIGEAFSVLMAKASSPAFKDPNNPTTMLLTPAGANAEVLLADLILATETDLFGAKLVEWRSGVNSGLWDVHYRMMAGSWGLFHMTGSGAGYIENTWMWTADHDIDSGLLVNVTNPRGLLIETAGPTYLIGTAVEHSSLYQYNFTGASNIYAVFTQTEIPYWIEPVKSLPLTIQDSSDIYMYGSGYYTWFHGNVTVGPTKIVNCKNTYLYANAVHNYINHLEGDHTIKANYTNTFCSFFAADVPY